MKILSHRGYWKTAEEKNQPVAFERSFKLGFGTETDIRDLSGNLVISHDMPLDDALTAHNMFDIHAATNPSLPLALNIKSDGIQTPLARLLEEFEVQDYFLFDMSIPDALVSLRHGLRCFTRQSEYEPDPSFYEQAEGVWIDGFHCEWWTEDIIAEHLDKGKRVALVSPDLHRRAYLPFWENLAGWDVRHHPHLMLCTDMPEEAVSIFAV